VKLYSNFVPIHGSSYTTVEKKINVPHELENDLKGEGEQEEESQSRSNELNEIERQNVLDSLNKSIKEKLPEKVYNSMLHPGGIKTGKILVNSNPEKEAKKRVNDEASTQDNIKKVKPNSVNHKFQLV